MHRVPPTAANPAPRHVGSAGVFILDVLAALIVGLIVSLILHFTLHIIWLSVIVGLAVVLLVLLIAAAAYFSSDFTRYTKIRGM